MMKKELQHRTFSLQLLIIAAVAEATIPTAVPREVAMQMDLIRTIKTSRKTTNDSVPIWCYLRNYQECPYSLPHQLF